MIGLGLLALMAMSPGERDATSIARYLDEGRVRAVIEGQGLAVWQACTDGGQPPPPQGASLWLAIASGGEVEDAGGGDGVPECYITGARGLTFPAHDEDSVTVRFTVPLAGDALPPAIPCRLGPSLRTVIWRKHRVAVGIVQLATEPVARLPFHPLGVAGRVSLVWDQARHNRTLGIVYHHEILSVRYGAIVDKHLILVHPVALPHIPGPLFGGAWLPLPNPAI